MENRSALRLTDRCVIGITVGLTLVLIQIYVYNYTDIIARGSWLDVLVKGVLDALLLAVTAFAGYHNRRKRNQLLFISLVFYALADALAAVNFVWSAPIYVIGHLVLIYNLTQTGMITKGQHRLVFALLAFGILLLMIFNRQITAAIEENFSSVAGIRHLIIGVWIFYMWILWSKLSFSLRNRYYLASAILFIASDVLAAFRVISILPEVPYFDVPCYFLGIMFYALSAFACREKEVVTFFDVADINRKLREVGVYYCLYGKWALNLSVKRYDRQEKNYELAYDVTQRDAMLSVLTNWLGFEYVRNNLPVEAELYSERYGSLILHGLWHDDEGSVLWLSGKSEGIPMDPDFFHTVHVLGNAIPCLFPVSEEDEILSFLRPDQDPAAKE
ncbi:MAG: hypothetical protein IJQ02_13120 [Oscillospiraceae bacterium]|nr:hypothetical protein [Oscillospiraceae bacterium]